MRDDKLIDKINKEYDYATKEKHKDIFICVFKLTSLIVFLGVMFYVMFSMV